MCMVIPYRTTKDNIHQYWYFAKVIWTKRQFNFYQYFQLYGMYFNFELTQLINSQPFAHSDDTIVVLNGKEGAM